MQYHLEHEIRIAAEEEYKSLYPWYLREHAADGGVIGDKLIPWGWGFWFAATEATYGLSIERGSVFSSREDGESSAKSLERVSAKLQPCSRRFGTREPDPRFEMWGTDRRLEEIHLSIERLDEESAEECCKAWGCPSYTSEIDFRDYTEPDHLIFTVRLRPSKFQKIVDLIAASRLDSLGLYVSGVSGFYSDWSPSVTTDHVKVLTADDSQKVVEDPAVAVKPPRLGPIAEFRLSIEATSELAASLGPDEDVEGETSEDAGSSIEPSPSAADITLERLVSEVREARALISSVTRPLWTIVALLAILAWLNW